MALNINTKIVNNLTGVVADASSIKGGYLSVDYYADLANLSENVVENGSLVYVKNISTNLAEVEGWRDFQSEEDYIGYCIDWFDSEHDADTQVVEVTEDNLAYLQENEFIVLGYTPCYNTSGTDPVFFDPGFYVKTGRERWSLLNTDEVLPLHLGEYAFASHLIIPVSFYMRNIQLCNGEATVRPLRINLYNDDDAYTSVQFRDGSDEATELFDFNGDKYTIQIVDQTINENGMECLVFDIQPLGGSVPILDFGTLTVSQDAVDAGVIPQLGCGSDYIAPQNPAMVLEFNVTEKMSELLGMVVHNPSSEQEFITMMNNIIDKLEGRQIVYTLNFYSAVSGEQSTTVQYSSQIHYNAVPLIQHREYYKSENETLRYYYIDLLVNDQYTNYRPDSSHYCFGASYKASLVYWTYTTESGDGSEWALVLYDNRVLLPMSEDLVILQEWFNQDYINYIGTSIYKAPIYLEDSYEYVGRLVLDVLKSINYSIIKYGEDYVEGIRESVELKFCDSQNDPDVESKEKEIVSLSGFSEGEAYNTYSWDKMMVSYRGVEIVAEEAIDTYKPYYVKIYYYNRFKDKMPLSMINEKGYNDQIPVLAQYPNIDIISEDLWGNTVLYKPQIYYTNGTQDLYFITSLGCQDTDAADSNAKVSVLELRYNNLNAEFTSIHAYYTINMARAREQEPEE